MKFDQIVIGAGIASIAVSANCFAWCVLHSGPEWAPFSFFNGAYLLVGGCIALIGTACGWR